MLEAEQELFVKYQWCKMQAHILLQTRGSLLLQQRLLTTKHLHLQMPFKHTEAAIWKIKTDEEKLVLRLSDEIYFDEIQIRLAPQSTYNREREDAIKIYSYNDVAPQLQSYSSDNIPLAVNSIPEAGTDNNIPIGIRSPKDGVYKISIVEVSDIISTNGIYLEDLLMNSWHKLSESGYTFTSPEGDISDRFIIHFGGVGIDEPVSTRKSSIFGLPITPSTCSTQTICQVR